MSGYCPVCGANHTANIKPEAPTVFTVLGPQPAPDPGKTYDWSDVPAKAQAPGAREFDLQELRELHSKSTPVISWYAHGRNDQCGSDEATVRGPYYRWFRVSGGEGYEKCVADVGDDAKYAAAAMNSVPHLISAYEALERELADVQAKYENEFNENMINIVDASRLDTQLTQARAQLAEARALHDDAVKEHDEECERSAALVEALQRIADNPNTGIYHDGSSEHEAREALKKYGESK